MKLTYTFAFYGQTSKDIPRFKTHCQTQSWSQKEVIVLGTAWLLRAAYNVDCNASTVVGVLIAEVHASLIPWFPHVRWSFGFHMLDDHLVSTF